MRERKIVPHENLMPRTHDPRGRLKTRSKSRDQEQNIQILGIHKEQIEQRGTVARAEQDWEIHEDQNEQRGESRNLSSHHREQEVKSNPTSNKKSKRKIELPHTRSKHWTREQEMRGTTDPVATAETVMHDRTETRTWTGIAQSKEGHPDLAKTVKEKNEQHNQEAKQFLHR
jgi:hypothetical protein